MKFNRIKGQSGFTLIELLVGLAILTLLAVTVAGAFDGSRSRAQALISAMAEVGNANIRLKNDTGCYVKRADALTMFDKGQAAANNFCNRDFTKTWNGPYLTKLATNPTNGNIKMDNISSDTEVSLPMPEAGGSGKRYFTSAKNLPNDVVKRALQECNSDMTEGATSTMFDTRKCRGTYSGTEGTGVFEVVYDETR